MSQSFVTSAYNSEQVPQIHRQQRNVYESLLSTENVLAATVKARDQLFNNYGHEVLEDFISEDETFTSQNGTILHHTLVGTQTKTVEDIEKWLRIVGDSNLNLKNDPRADIEKYLSYQLPEIFFEKDSLSIDNDMITKKLNVSCDGIYQEIPNDKLLPAYDKEDMFLLPNLQLDNLDSLAFCSDGITVSEENSPSTSASTTSYNSNINTKELIKKLKDSFNRYSDDDQFIEDIHTENLSREINESDFEHVNNGELYSSSLSKSFDLYSNGSSNDSDNINYDSEREFNQVIYNDTMEQEDSLLEPFYQIKSKKSQGSSKKVTSSDDSSNTAKTKFRPSIIKRKRKLDEMDRFKNCEDNMPIIDVQEKIKSKSIETNKTHNHKKNLKNKQKKNRLITSDFSESDQEDNLTTKPYYYFNQQELAITKALEDVGINNKVFQHIITEENGKIWLCHQDKCDRQFVKLCSLKAHLLTHFGIRPFKCDFEGCSWAFYSDFKLKRHKETHLKKKDYMCSIPGCKRRFTTIYNLASHEKLHTRPNRITCQVPECDSKFQTKRDLENHMKTHDQSLAPYVCKFDKCGKRYYSSNALMSHQRCHSYSHTDITCSWDGCGKSFDQPCRLKAHMRSHTGSKPYTCTFKGCKWAFTTSSKLKRHQKKHTNDRKFVCDINNCNKAFMRSEHLKEHKLTHVEERLFQCNLCTASFSAKSTLYVHVKKHKIDDPMYPLDLVTRTRRQPKRKRTVEKKTLNKKKEIHCSRVQAIKMPIIKLNKNLLISNGTENETKIINQEDDNSDENIQNIVTESTLVSPVVECEESRILYNMYFCPIESCMKCYLTKSSLKLHLDKDHSSPFNEIKKNNVTYVASSPLSQEIIPSDFTFDNESQKFLNNSTDEALVVLCETTGISTADTDSTIEENTSMECEQPNVQDVQTNVLEQNIIDTFAINNGGSARTSLTRENVLNLKPNRKIIKSSLESNDIVLSAASFNATDLLLPDDLSTIYCQEDISVPEYQILLLDTDSTDDDVSMQNLK